MFNIRNLVSRISQGKQDGEGSETSSTKSRNASQVSVDETGAEAEGFLCPTCFTAFPTPDELQSHYQSDHLEPGANYLCPVCKARLGTASELEQHYAANHSTSEAGSSDAETLRKEVIQLKASLNEERWGAEELRKEIALFKEIVTAQGTGDEQQMFQQQLQGLQETKSLLTSEVVLLRKQLAESLESTLALRQEREKAEEKAAKHSQTVVQLRAALDENAGLSYALKEQIKELESQLEHKSSLDDAETLKKELTSVQRLMDEMTQAREIERDEWHSKFEQLRLEHEALVFKTNNEPTSPVTPAFDWEAEKLKLEDELRDVIERLNRTERTLTEKSDLVSSMQLKREETDVCVVRLREEVTALQDMLNEARNQAEGQVSAKEDELLNARMELVKQEQQVNSLQSRCQELQDSVSGLTTNLAQKERELDERSHSLKQMESKAASFEEKVVRLEQERGELMATIQKGEGFDTAIQQLQKDNARLQEELSGANVTVESMETAHRKAADEWSVTVEQLKGEVRKNKEAFDQTIEELDRARQAHSAEVKALTDRSAKEAQEWRDKVGRLTSRLKELEAECAELKQQLAAERQSHGDKMKVLVDRWAKEGQELQDSLSQSSLKTKELELELARLQSEVKAGREGLQEAAKEKETLLSEVESHKLEVTKREKDLSDFKEQMIQLKAAHQNEVGQLDNQVLQLRQQLTSSEQNCQKLAQEADKRGKDLSSLEEQLNRLKFAQKEQAERLESQLLQIQQELTSSEQNCQKLQQKVAELEPLTEALEEEKLRRIKEKSEWGEHEQLLRGEKESLSTLSTHLQQQLDEQVEEHRIHVQRLRNELDSLANDRNQLDDQLSAEKEARSRENVTWQEKHSKLVEEVRSLSSSLASAQDLAATRYQRCEELQASADKYHALKLELETRLALLQDEKSDLQNSCSQWETEVDRLKFNAVELRRRLEDSQAALHELGRENQSLQMENAKLQGRKWADDSEVDECHSCQKTFNLTVRKHHCRNCGQIFCNECSARSTAVGNSRKPVRVCDPCFKELNNSSR